MFISRLCQFAVGIQMALAFPVSAQTSGPPDLGALLANAQRYTVKVRSTVHWPFAPEQVGTGTGTGFIIDRDKGWILTNAHVAKRSAATVEIALSDAESEWIPVEHVYIDNHLDLAVLKVKTDKLPADAKPAKLGCTQSVKQGATVVAYGHPINLNFTATRGIVSSVRTLGSHEYVQMDANINPGNSGGPLLAVDAAEVIGINTATMAGAPGLGLALAIRHVCPVLDLLAKGSDPSLPGIPVYWLKQGRVETMTVAATFPNLAKDTANADDALKQGDVVQGFASGEKIANVPDLLAALRGRQGQVMFNILRDGKPRTARVTLIPPRTLLKRQALTFAGMMIAERINLDTPDMNLPPLRIEFIKPGELAARAGFLPWDQLDMVAGQRFATVASLNDWLKSRPANEKMAVLVRRNTPFDARATAEYHRFEIQPTDLKLITAGD